MKNKNEKDLRTKNIQVYGRANRKCNVRDNSYEYVDVPIVKLSGVWLNRFNFYGGDLVNVTAHKNKIVIKKIKQVSVS